MHAQRNQSGFGAIELILISVVVVALVLLGGYIYRSLQNMNRTYSAATTTSNAPSPAFASKQTGKNTATLRGTISEGPTSPLTQAGNPDSSPVANHTVQAKNAQGIVTATTKTDGQGKYVFRLAPGQYTLVLVPPVGVGDLTDNSVQVKPGTNSLNISADTGIR